MEGPDQDKNQPQKEEEEDFTLTEIVPDIFLCRERHYTSGNVANLYVIRGTKMDLVVDTGIGLWDFAAFLQSKGLIHNGSSRDNNNDKDKPCLAVATHVHFDHAGGLYQFQHTAIHELEASALVASDSYEACCFMTDSECAKPPHPTWRARDYKLRGTTPSKILQNGDVLDLGNKEFRVLHLPGHSRGSIALYNERDGMLFSGDVVYDATLYDFLPYSHIPDYVRSFEQLLELSPNIKHVFPGHEDMFDGLKLKEIAEAYLERTTTCYECKSLFPKLITTIYLKGRNTKEACPQCCYVSCCCHLWIPFD